MDSLFNTNFMMTFLLARDLPESKDKVVMALAGAQSRNLMTPILLKVGPIDRIGELEQKNSTLVQENTTLRSRLAPGRKVEGVDLERIVSRIGEKRDLNDLKADAGLMREIFDLAPHPKGSSQA